MNFGNNAMVNTETIRQTGFKQNEKSTNGINRD